MDYCSLAQVKLSHENAHAYTPSVTWRVHTLILTFCGWYKNKPIH